LFGRVAFRRSIRDVIVSGRVVIPSTPAISQISSPLLSCTAIIYKRFRNRLCLYYESPLYESYSDNGKLPGSIVVFCVLRRSLAIIFPMPPSDNPVSYIILSLNEYKVRSKWFNFHCCSRRVFFNHIPESSKRKKYATVVVSPFLPVSRRNDNKNEYGIMPLE